MTSPEELALADVTLRPEPLPLAIAGETASGAAAWLASPVSLESARAAITSPAGAASASSLDSRSSTPVPPPHTSIRIHVLLGKIDGVAKNAVAGEPPIDCIAVAHCLRVLPTGAELDLDRAISKALRAAQAAPAQSAPAAGDSDDDLLISQSHEREPFAEISASHSGCRIPGPVTRVTCSWWPEGDRSAGSVSPN